MNKFSFTFSNTSTRVCIFSFLLIINYSLLITHCYSQPSITWNKIYDGPLHHDDGAVAICQANQGFYFVFCYTSSFNPSKTYLLKINEYGDTLWTKFYPQLYDFKSTVSTLDGGCIFTGIADSSCIVKIDYNGNVQWIKYYNQDLTVFNDIRKTSDGGYVACGYRPNTFDGYLIKIRSNGDLQWQKVFPTTYILYLNSVVEGIDSGFLAAGAQTDFLGDTTKILIEKVDSSGKTQWEKKLKVFNQEAGCNYINKLNNGYVITGRTDIMFSQETERVYFTKLDIIGNEISSKIYPFYKNDEIKFTSVINNNKILIGSWAFSQLWNNDTSYAKIILIDSTGNFIQQKLYTANNYVILYSMFPLENNDMIFGGTIKNFSYEDILLIRTDSLINGPPIGIKQLSNIVPQDFKLYQNYPNPFNASTKIKFDIKKEGLVEIKIYDVLGKELQILLTNYLKLGEYDIYWNGNNLASGIYFFELSFNNEIIGSKKMILLK